MIKIGAIAGALVAIVGFIGVIGKGGFEYYDYKKNHLPEFKELEVRVQYESCITQCQNTCQRNNIPLDECDCSHCNTRR